MKFTKLSIILAFTSLSFTSCEKYLDVKPKTQIEIDVMFSNEEGFKDALHGVYTQLSSNNSYGLALTQTTIERLISAWDFTAATTEAYLNNHNYTAEGSQNAFNSIFQQQYKTIASINALLSKIDENKDVFKNPDLYKMIKSEALALRAFIHLDLMRLWGPIPTNTIEGNQLAYVTQFSTKINDRISYDKYKELLFKDISEAENLSKDVDPILKYSLAQMRSPSNGIGYNPDDIIFAFRYLKMNYYAIKGLQARAHLWYGEKEQAYEAAKVVIDAKNVNGTNKYDLGSATDFAAKDFVLTKEHLFGIYDYQMYDKYQKNYANIALKKGTAETTVKNTLYGNTGTDIREASLWHLLTMANGSKGNTLKKYMVDEPKTVTNATDYKQIPLIRLSEMYLIASETAPFAEGINYFKAFRTSRGIGANIPATEANLKAEILKEYQKEFFGEGQGFYAHKRYNSIRTAIIFAATSVTVNYLLPLPTVESVNQ